MRELLFLFLFGMASCGDPCNCDNLSTDPFNSSTMPSGCGCIGGKIFVPDIGTDAKGDIGSEVKSTTDLQTGHKVK